MRPLLDSLLPPGSAWRPKPDGHFDYLLDGVADNLEAVRSDMGALGLARDPWRTPYLAELERDFGVDPNPQLTEAQRRQTLALVMFARDRRGTIDDLQAALDRAGLGDGGYGLHVYPNDPAVDPGLFTDRSPQTMCNGDNAYCGYTIDGLALADWSGVAHDGSVFCAVSRDGLCATSPDAVTWTDQAGIPAGVWQAIVWNGSVFCALGVDVCATSPDGITWTARTIDAGDWRAVCWSGSQFCAVGAGPTNYCATSPTGTTWTTQAGLPASYEWNGIAHNGSLFCVVGGKTYTSVIRTSPDGITWTPRWGQVAVERYLQAIAWNGSLFCALTGKRALTSADGISWSIYSIPSGTFYTLAWAPALGLFVAVGSGANQCITSPTGTTWTARKIAPGAWRALAWSGSLLCAMGNAGLAEATSPDGVTWTVQGTGVLAYCGYKGGGVFIVNGDVLSQAPAYLGCGHEDMLCNFISTGGSDVEAVCGRYITLTYTPVVVASPADAWSWPCVFFLAAGATTDDDGYILSMSLASLPSNLRQTLIELVLRWKPIHSWAVLMADFN